MEPIPIRIEPSHGPHAAAPGSARPPGPAPKRRILHVITRLVRGGADENTVETIAGIDHERYAVDLAIGRESERELFELPAHAGLHVIPHLVRDIHPWADLRALIELRALMCRRRYDLVHTHTAKAGFLGRVAAALAGVPRVVHTYHGVTFHPEMSRLRRTCYVAAERVAAHLTHRFIAVGEEVRQSYVEARVAPESCRVIYSGMDLGRFQGAARVEERVTRERKREFAIPPHAIVVGIVSRLEERKGHHYLLEAMEPLFGEFPNLHLLIAGEGPRRQALVARIARTSFRERIHLVGHRPDAERVMSVIDVLALTSVIEGLPRVLVQAAALGKPIVAFAAPGVREVVVHGLNGYVVAVGDVASLTVYLRTMLRDLGQARTMGQQGLALVDDRWSAARTVSEVNAVYDDMLRAA